MTEGSKEKNKKEPKGSKDSLRKRKDRLEDAMRLMEEEDLYEIEVVDGPFQLKLVREPKVPPAQPYHEARSVQDVSQEHQAPLPPPVEKGVPVKAPLGGVFYQSPSPKSPPFIKVGEPITKGQTLGIIEAMKVMNEVKAEISGRVIKILIENGKPVEANQTMIIVDTD